MHRRAVTFRTDRFESRTPKRHFINPNCFGEDLVAWLRPGLQDAGIEPGEPIQEDYGWGLWTELGGDAYWLAASRIEEMEEDGAVLSEVAQEQPNTPPEWGIVIAYEPGFNLWRRLTHRPRAEDLDRISAAVDRQLRGDPAISEVAWWDGEPFHGSSREHP